MTRPFTPTTSRARICASADGAAVMQTLTPLPPVSSERRSFSPCALQGDDGGLHLLAEGEPLGAQVVHEDLRGAGHEGDLRVHEADGAGADDQHRVARDDGDSLEGVVDAGQRLDERGGHEVRALRESGRGCPGDTASRGIFMNGANPPGMLMPKAL